MRCLSPHSNYSIQVFEGKETVMMEARGHAYREVTKEPVIANFEQTGLTEYEILEALEHFNFSGVPEGINPLSRIAVFDTDLYIEQKSNMDEDLDKEELAELRVRIENRLRKLQTKHPSEFIIVDPPRHFAPWPSYDEDSVEEILAARERFGFSPEAVRLYEVENKNRDEIIDAMTALENETASTGEIVVSA